MNAGAQSDCKEPVSRVQREPPPDDTCCEGSRQGDGQFWARVRGQWHRLPYALPTTAQTPTAGGHTVLGATTAAEVVDKELNSSGSRLWRIVAPSTPTPCPPPRRLRLQEDILFWE